MKHLANYEKKTRRGRLGNFIPTGVLRQALVLVLLLTGLFVPHSLHAQCTLVCNSPFPENANQLAVNIACEAIFTPDVILESPQSCPGPKLLTVRDDQSNIIVEGVDFVSFDASPYIDGVVSVTVTDVETGILCVGFVNIVDNLSPSIQCQGQDASISCVGDTSAAAIGFPDISDNCNLEIILSYEDDFVDNDCISPNAAVLTRTWTATDGAGNTATCVQTITLERPSLDDIVYPDQVTLSCDDPSADISITGEPTLDGFPIENGGICNLACTHADDTTALCGNIEFLIIRTWTVVDDCSGFVANEIQIIEILDQSLPQIICPGDLTFTTLPGQCQAEITLPAPQVTDNCTANPDFVVSTSYGAVGLGPHPFVPVGTHTVQYTGIDECGNTSICSINLTVFDDEEPVAVCDDLLIVSIPSGGLAIVDAISFDEGSHDNCADTVYHKVRRMDIGGCDSANGDDASLAGYQEWFDDYVAFCCEEVDGANVIVLLRAYEIDPGPGPVDPVRELPGGDLYGHWTECTSAAKVEDQLPPVLQCPDNMTVECEEDFSDLGVFGSPDVFDNCSYTLDSVEVISLNECSVGTITRTFTAIDDVGFSVNCTQTISVVNSNPFNESLIIWPADYTTDICGASVDPEDLPQGLQEPVILDESCAIVSINYEDALFDIAFPACYKILRTWTVLDWCSYDPDHPENGGRYSDIQIIKVKDPDAPVISCPSAITVGVMGNCETAQVTLPPATVEDCSPETFITNDSPYAFSGGSDASGVYPLGTNAITFYASDKCGNVSGCEISITVVDQKPPSPICIVGLSINLSNMDGEIMAMIDAVTFDGGSFDNCTAYEDLDITIRRAIDNPDSPPTETGLVFTCDDVGIQLVELWVTDELGNSDYCMTYLAVQDNNDICPLTAVMGTIAGGITTEEGENVEDVTVMVNNSDLFEAITDENGNFQFPVVPMGNDYSVVPYRNNDNLNGVSTIDMVLISKHILGITNLDSPYKIIAGDIDKSGAISTLDLIKLRKLILHIDTEFPNGNSSWRFIDASFEFPNPENPFESYFPEIYNINNFDDDEMHADFIAVKIGDVNDSATPNSLVGIDDRSTFGALTIKVENREVRKGSTVTVEFTAENMDQILGYQFTLGFDKEILEFEAVKERDLPNLSEANFGMHSLDEGLLTTSWNEMESNMLPREAVLFGLEFKVIEDAELKDLFTMSSRMTRAEAYSRDEELLRLYLQFVAEEEVDDGFHLFQNRPNPFEDQTAISFTLPETAQLTMTIYDLSGKVIYRREGVFSQGYNEIAIKRSDLRANGILYYRLESDKYKATKKMMVLK